MRFRHFFRHLSDHPSIWRYLLWICTASLQKATLVRIHPGLREWRRAFPRRLSANSVWARVWTVDIHRICTVSRMQIRGTGDTEGHCDAFAGIVLTSVWFVDTAFVPSAAPYLDNLGHGILPSELRLTQQAAEHGTCKGMRSRFRCEGCLSKRNSKRERTRRGRKARTV